MNSDVQVAVIGAGGGSAEFLSAWMTTGKPPFELDIVHTDRFGNDMTTESALDSKKKFTPWVTNCPIVFESNYF
jgi:hypothetical protein